MHVRLVGGSSGAGFDWKLLAPKRLARRVLLTASLPPACHRRAQYGESRIEAAVRSASNQLTFSPQLKRSRATIGTLQGGCRSPLHIAAMLKLGRDYEINMTKSLGGVQQSEPHDVQPLVELAGLQLESSTVQQTSPGAGDAGSSNDAQSNGDGAVGRVKSDSACSHSSTSTSARTVWWRYDDERLPELCGQYEAIECAEWVDIGHAQYLACDCRSALAAYRQVSFLHSLFKPGRERGRLIKEGFSLMHEGGASTLFFRGPDAGKNLPWPRAWPRHTATCWQNFHGNLWPACA